MGQCLGKHADDDATIVSSNVTARERRRSMTLEEEDVLSASEPNACAVVTEPGVEWSRPKVNQDAYFVDEARAVYAIFDGHGKNGHLCSRFYKEHMAGALAAAGELRDGADLCRVLVSVDNQLKLETSINCQFSGTTVTCCAVTARDVLSAWLGDSRAVMGRWAGTEVSLVELSQDHKPDNPAEKRRILKAGGRLRQIVDEDGRKAGGLRVFVPSKDIPGVGFSRSSGDRVIQAYGVSSEVECVVTPRTADDKFIVVASDGVFEFVPSKEVVQLVSVCRTVDEAAQVLMQTAKQRWLEAEGSSDDITAAVIKLA